MHGFLFKIFFKNKQEAESAIVVLVSMYDKSIEEMLYGKTECKQILVVHDIPDIVVQVLDPKLGRNRYMFTASDRTKKLKTILQSSLSSELLLEKVQNRVLIRVLEYTLDVIPNKPEKF
ncbi:unnamed protein product [Vicia faba]|uniref:Replication factor-A protein 1 N-terminal domain-containing protein n=1 Tax=Vicia faba TaxID=3906 RepID=A0AAV1A988_VICFA|nr:unnamed protein product [Vicia faba]